MKLGELLILADDVRADRLEGTEGHWWQENIGTFALREGFGEHSHQNAADKRRIMRLARLEAALLHLMEIVGDDMMEGG